MAKRLGGRDVEINGQIKFICSNNLTGCCDTYYNRVKRFIGYKPSRTYFFRKTCAYIYIYIYAIIIVDSIVEVKLIIYYWAGDCRGVYNFEIHPKICIFLRRIAVETCMALCCFQILKTYTCGIKSVHDFPSIIRITVCKSTNSVCDLVNLSFRVDLYLRATKPLSM